MRILLVSQHDFSWPSEMQVLGFAQELVHQGHEVMMSIGGDSATLDKEGLALGAEFRLQRHTFVGPAVRRRARAAARAFQPDIIHAWNPRAPTLAAARSYAKATRAPYAVHFEDDDFLPWPLGVTGWYQRCLYALRRYGWRLHPPAWGMALPSTIRWARDEAVGLDAVTPELAREVSERLGRDCTVLLPVMTSADPRRPLGESALRRRDGEKLVLFSGRIVPSAIPDVTIAMEAVASLRRRGLDVRLVQTGRVAFGFDLNEHARRHGIDEGGFTSLAHIPFCDVIATLRDADILVQPGPPSRFNRLRLPSKMQNYLASGTPTVTFAVGFGELLADREEVLKTYTDSPVELAERLAELLTDPKLYARLSRGGLAAADRLFNGPRNAEALVRHYEHCLGAA